MQPSTWPLTRFGAPFDEEVQIILAQLILTDSEFFTLSISIYTPRQEGFLRINLHPPLYVYDLLRIRRINRLHWQTCTSQDLNNCNQTREISINHRIKVIHVIQLVHTLCCPCLFFKHRPQKKAWTFFFCIFVHKRKEILNNKFCYARLLSMLYAYVWPHHSSVRVYAILFMEVRTCK